MKCPFCQQELVKDTPFAWNCPNEECVETDMMWGTANMWQELIRTRKALEIAVNALNSAGTHNSINCIARGEDPSKDDVGITINHALNEIKTALEQKD